MSTPNKKSFADWLGGLSSQTLYLMLIVVCVIPLFIRAEIPSKSEDQSVDLFVSLMQLPADKPVLISSDWTNSSRGESAGQFEALMRILMRRNIKIFLFSFGDPQAPQVARDVIARINEERKATGEAPYEVWKDWVDAGFYSDPNFALGATMKADVRAAFANKTARRPDGTQANIWESDVLKNVRKLQDFSILLNITASSTVDYIVSRLSGSIPIGVMCTGVTGPGVQPYYQASQIVGVSIGLKGVYDIERMMEYGVKGTAIAKPDFKGGVSKKDSDLDIPGFAGKKNLDRGSSYYLALHAALALMIIAVIAGNIGLIASKMRRSEA